LRKLPYKIPRLFLVLVFFQDLFFRAGVSNAGVITSSTNELTILPKAAPMITPTARSIAFPLAINSLNFLKFHFYSVILTKVKINSI
jgi:hypothetical protein